MVKSPQAFKMMPVINHHWQSTYPESRLPQFPGVYHGFRAGAVRRKSLELASSCHFAAPLVPLSNTTVPLLDAGFDPGPAFQGKRPCKIWQWKTSKSSFSLPLCSSASPAATSEMVAAASGKEAKWYPGLGRAGNTRVHSKKGPGEHWSNACWPQSP